LRAPRGEPGISRFRVRCYKPAPNGTVNGAISRRYVA
jgi:hypothetical protein